MEKIAKVLSSLVFVSALLVSSACAQNTENLTITTYYPSPFGSYRNLTVEDTLFINSTHTGGEAGHGIFFTGQNVGPVWDSAFIHLHSYSPNVSELRLEIADDYNQDTVYVGGNKGGLSGGNPGGITVNTRGQTDIYGSFTPSVTNPTLELRRPGGKWGDLKLREIFFCS